MSKNSHSGAMPNARTASITVGEWYVRLYGRPGAWIVRLINMYSHAQTPVASAKHEAKARQIHAQVVADLRGGFVYPGMPGYAEGVRP